MIAALGSGTTDTEISPSDQLIESLPLSMDVWNCSHELESTCKSDVVVKATGASWLPIGRVGHCRQHDVRIICFNLS
jgi:hypothetical protein